MARQDKDPARKLRDRLDEESKAQVEVDDATLDRKKYPNLDEARAVKATEIRGRRIAKVKADAVAEAFANHPGRGPDGTLTVSTSRGPVRFGAVNTVVVDDTTHVDVWLAGETAGGDPHFRIFNPPTLVQDPEGDVSVRGVAWREDPLTAVAEVVAANGGAQKGQRR